MQHLVGKPLFKKQKYEFKDTVGLYRTIYLPFWQDACSCLDSLGFLKGDFYTPLGVWGGPLPWDPWGVCTAAGAFGGGRPIWVAQAAPCGEGLHSGAPLN